ncbi:MAG TPA: PEGA domain-containing protein [Vicinamibacterales bacterium]
MDTTALDGGAIKPRDPRSLFVRLFRLGRTSANRRRDAATDPLDAFSRELAAGASGPSRPAERRPRRTRARAWLVVLGIALAISSIAAVRLRMSATSVALQNGTVAVDTLPAGVKVDIDGRPQGRTPVVLSLAPGSHAMTLINDREQRIVPLTVIAGRQSSEHFEFAAKALTPTVGMLLVTADVPSRVNVDGRALGSAPAVVPNLAPGDHLVSVTSDTGTVTRRVAVSPGATASAAFSFAASRTSGPAAGWMSFSAPFDMQVFEGKDLIGSSGAKVMVAAGRHELRLVNDALQYSETRGVEVTAGKVSAIQIDPPHTTLNVNARPWADVSIDGTEIGQTPLANVSIAIGPHVVVFRHPQLGEQRRTITATAKGPNRVSADLTGK